MFEQEQVLNEFGVAGVTAALLWATRSAHARASHDFDPETGHNQTVLGTTAHTLLTDRLDRVFRCESYMAASLVHDLDNLDLLIAGLTQADVLGMPKVTHGAVVRANLNGSPGWRLGDYQWFLSAYSYGQVDHIPWNRKSPTKQRVAAQMGRLHPGQLMIAGSFDEPVDFVQIATIEELLAADPDQPTTRLVLAHSVEPSTGLSEVYLGRPRRNVGGGPSWVWRVPLIGDDDEGDALGGRPYGPAPRPRDRDDVADAPVRLRPRSDDEATGRDTNRS